MWILAGAVLGLVLGGWDRLPLRREPTLDQIQALSELVTTRISVHDVVETQIKGFTGSIRAVLVVRGDFLLGIDLSQARLEQVDPVRRSAVLVLPDPRVQSPRLDHEKSRLYALDEQGLWRIVPGREADRAVMDRLMREAQGRIARSGADSRVLEQSRQQAQRVIGDFARMRGWTIHLRWVDSSQLK